MLYSLYDRVSMPKSNPMIKDFTHQVTLVRSEECSFSRGHTRYMLTYINAEMVHLFDLEKVERKRDEKLYRARLGGFYLMVLSDFLLVMGLILELTFRTGHLFEVILPFSFIISTVFIVIIIIKRLV